MTEIRLVTYGELVQQLNQMNYSRDPARSYETYTCFDHPDASVPIILPVMPSDQAVPRVYLAGIRRILEESNSAVAPAFEQWAYVPAPLDLEGVGPRGRART